MNCKRCKQAREYIKDKMHGIYCNGAVYYDEHKVEYSRLQTIYDILEPSIESLGITKERLQEERMIK